MSYLDPKNDLTFKLIFGEHPHLLKSFLNSLLILPSPIQTLSPLPTELLPELVENKTSIVDVRCTDEQGRQFLVEMQMIWTESFMKRVLYNSTKAYSQQSKAGGKYNDLMTIYSICILNDIFQPDLEEYMHEYDISNKLHADRKMYGLEYVFIELPKLKTKNIAENEVGVLWLRFLSEIKSNQEVIPEELLEIPEIREAIELLNKKGFSKAQLEAYDKYWDFVSIEKSLEDDAYEKGREEGIDIGLQKGEEIGLQKGREEAEEIGEQKLREKEKLIVRNLIQKGFSTKEISEITGLTEEEIESVISD